MSVQYDNYLQQHKNNVYKGFEWIQQNLPELLVDGVGWQTEFAHDASKSESDEYEAYDAYYYGGNRSYQVVQDYNRAWLLHLHRNPHHWQYWVLINDDPNEGEIVLDMPDNYILEMICDWWAFSWAKGNLQEIFGWYDEHKDYMKLSDQTRKSVELILSKIKEKLSDEEQLAHHGVKGQKWGVRRTPEQLGHDKKVAKVLNTGDNIDDTYIHKSVGAKSRNYDVLDPGTGEYLHFSEGTRIRDSKVFAGKGGTKPLDTEVALGLSEQIGGDPNEWQHCKGVGTIDYHGEDVDAEVHWFQENSVGKHKFKVKKWLD